MKIEIVQLFFANLAKRLDSENSLSDVTWAVCETNPEFKRLFIEFFFKDIINEAPDIVLEREYSGNKSRVDFRFAHRDASTQLETVYIIEVKIYDGDDHFEKYKKAFPGAKFGWIANYRKEIALNDGIVVKTWEDFYFYLQSELSKNSGDTHNLLIEGYCTYVKSVCSIIKMKTMNLNNLSSLLYFNKVVNEIVNTSHRGIICKKYKSTAAINDSWYGSFFTVKREDTRRKNDIYPWFGVSYDENGTWIGIFFSREWGGSIFQKFKSGHENGKYFQKAELSKDKLLLWFKLKPEYFNRFNETSLVEDQKRILTDFFEEVLDLVKDSIYQ